MDTEPRTNTASIILNPNENKKRTRCRNGTRWNRTLKRCIEKKVNPNVGVDANVINNDEFQRVNSPPITISVKKKTRCRRGFKKDPKNPNNCIPKEPVQQFPSNASNIQLAPTRTRCPRGYVKDAIIPNKCNKKREVATAAAPNVPGEDHALPPGRKRCPRGFIRNPINPERCIRKVNVAPRPSPQPQQPQLPGQPPQPQQPPTRKRRCPRGHKQNPQKPGDCIPSNEFVKPNKTRKKKSILVINNDDNVINNISSKSTSTENKEETELKEEKEDTPVQLDIPVQSDNINTNVNSPKTKTDSPPVLNTDNSENVEEGSSITKPNSPPVLNTDNSENVEEGSSITKPNSPPVLNTDNSENVEEGSPITKTDSPPVLNTDNNNINVENNDNNINVENNDSNKTTNTSVSSVRSDQVYKDGEYERKVEEDEVNEYNNDYYKSEYSTEFLYPNIEDPQFNLLISQRPEFRNYKYDGKIDNVELISNLMCSKRIEFPHQSFVRNFIHFNTPYNGLLLYHGLGTGKTCSAIGIAEENLKYLKKMDYQLFKSYSHRDKNPSSSKKLNLVIIIAAPNVQASFRSELFNPTKLEKVNGLWNIQSCAGKFILQELDLNELEKMEKNELIEYVESRIKSNYSFFGYTEFANYLQTIMNESNIEIKKQVIEDVFNHHLIIIDEVHNIRINDDNSKEGEKKTIKYLFEIAKYSKNLKFVLLSATPMYNSPDEIIWITDLLNVNDNREKINRKHVFDKHDNLIEPGGVDLLRRKLTGYVSYVRSENPYTFPYRIYQSNIVPYNTDGGHQAYGHDEYNTVSVPTISTTNTKLLKTQQLQYIPVFFTKLTSVQNLAYAKIMQFYQQQKHIIKLEEDNNKKLTFDNISYLLQALNIIYPPINSNSIEINSDEQLFELVGGRGLKSVMTYEEKRNNAKPEIGKFAYIQNRPRIFHLDNLHEYSAKMAFICKTIRNSSPGIILIYTQYIQSGILPMSLALEEMGLVRYSSNQNKHIKSLFEPPPPTSPIDSIKMIHETEFKREYPNSQFQPAQYTVISGDKSLSPDNRAEMDILASNENKNGEIIKVVLITKAGAEGLDFKNIRQIHILDNWYNMNRIEQIIGRGVRNKSHCALDFSQRNTEIYLHASISETDPEKECADAYLYRFAEEKSKKIGKVSRILKESAVDCILNIEQTNFTVEKMNALVQNQNIQLSLTSLGGEKVVYKIGDKPYSSICDYMEKCSYNCVPMRNNRFPDVGNNIQKTINLHPFKYNFNILYRIRDLFMERVHYTQRELLGYLKEFEIEEVLYLLTLMIRNKLPVLIDKKGRRGYLINKSTVYAFQPEKITDENISIYERTVPYEMPRLTYRVQEEDNFVTTNNPPQFMNNYETIMEMLQTAYDSVTTITDTRPYNSLNAHERDFSVNVLFMKEKMKTYFHIPYKCIYKYTILHILDSLSTNQKFQILHESLKGRKPTDFLTQTIYFYCKSKITREKYLYLDGILYKHETDNDNPWIQTDLTTIRDELNPEEINILQEVQRKIPTLKNITEINYNPVFGFFHDNVFKLIDTNKRMVEYGFNVQQAAMPKLKTLLKEFIDVYNENLTEETKETHKNSYNPLGDAGLKKVEMSVLIEFFVRYLQDLRNKTPCSKDDPSINTKLEQVFFIDNISESYIDSLKQFISNKK